MNIYQKFKDYYQNRKLVKLRRQLEMIERSSTVFNALSKYLPSETLQSNEEELKFAENLVWNSADPEAIRAFYTTRDPRISSSYYYWRSAPEHERIVHSGIPSLISEKMATVIFGAGYQVNYQLPSGSDELKIVADKIFEKINLAEKLNLAAQTESWSGHIAFKLSYDLALSPLPILEICDRRKFERIEERGITLGVKYHMFYDVKKNENAPIQRYRLTETYSLDENGDAVIQSKLYKLDGARVSEVPLTTIPKTAAIEPLVVFKDFKEPIHFDKANLESTKTYGKTDYYRSFSVFDSLDESVSGIFNELRNNRTQRFMPESMIPVDDNGEYRKMSEFVTSFIKIQGDIDQNGDSTPTYQFIPDKTMDHMEKYRIAVCLACVLSGLSPISLGITGLESLNSSDKSTRERAKTTLETRKTKLKLWAPFLAKFIATYLQFTQYLQKESGGEINPKFDLTHFDLSDLIVSISFNDYIESGIEDRVNIWSLAKTSGVASTTMAVDRIHGSDLSDKAKREEVRRIRMEQNLLLDPDDQVLKLNVGESEDGSE